ncbi:protein kinase [Actinomadura viridis]|uniref:protein kinase domain-containing protein n=1 Tax=Actinomadura viridis TaxID=58110 RepID=UPI00368EED8D
MDDRSSRPGTGTAGLRGLGPQDPTRVGSYELDAKIGEGGMGAVYLGRGPDGRQVAVKVVRPELAGDRAFVARFGDECRNAERVASFCTAQVLGHGQDLGMAYMVTEYIEGPSLLQHIGDHGTLSPGMLHGVAVGVAAALVAIHAAGLVHRDLKPSNVLLSISGPRVIDFGIARALDMATSHTRTGQVVGTPGYIAPEQILTQEVTPAIDVFAWGCLVAYAANGRNPFGEGSLQIMVGRALHGAPELGALTEPLAGLVQAALRKDPRTRPTARDLLLSLVGGVASEAAVTTTLGESWASPTVVGSPGDAAPGPVPPVPPGPAGQTVTDPSSRARTPEPAPPAPAPSPPTGPVGPTGPTSPYGPASQYGRTSPAGPNPMNLAGPAALTDVMDGPAGTTTTRRPRRKGARVAGAAVLAAVLAAGGGYLLAELADGGGKASASSPPADRMFVRVDTAPGWPGDCKADIGTYTPGQAAPVTIVPGDTCDTLPERSPADPGKLAFTRRNGGRVEAWVVNADGGGARRITDRLSGGRVTWSPDGKRLAFMGRDGAVRQIFTITIGESEPRRLTTDPAGKDDPMWSSTGRLVYWSKRDGAEQLYSLDPDRPETAPTRLTRDGVRSVDPEWSPDGKMIAFTRGVYPNGHLWVMNADGSGARQLTKGSAHEMDAAWSRDGRWVAYTRGPYESPELRVLRVDGTGDRPFGPANGVVGHANWS